MLGGSGVVLFDSEFFAQVLTIEPRLGECRKILTSLNVEFSTCDKNSFAKKPSASEILSNAGVSIGTSM